MEKIVGLCVQFGDIEDNYQVYRTHFPEMLDFDPVRAVYEWAKGKVSIGWSLLFGSPLMHIDPSRVFWR